MATYGKKWDALGMDREQHARALRLAMAGRRLRNQGLADLAGVSLKTVGNWISETKPTMPSEADRMTLRRIFPNYEKGVSDPVEAALAQTDLAVHRQRAVLAEYERHVYEQQREAKASR